jgi:hypothetical protein
VKWINSTVLLALLALAVVVLTLHGLARGQLVQTCVTSDGSLARDLNIANEARDNVWLDRANAKMPMSQCVWEWRSAPGFWGILL